MFTSPLYFRFRNYFRTAAPSLLFLLFPHVEDFGFDEIVQISEVVLERFRVSLTPVLDEVKTVVDFHAAAVFEYLVDEYVEAGLRLLLNHLLPSLLYHALLHYGSTLPFTRTKFLVS